MDGERSMHKREEKYMQSFVGKLEGRRSLKEE
jgi:hypothetical protein